MTLLVFSDSHGYAQPMLDVLGREAENATACFFLGDGVRDADKAREAFPSLPLYVVCGNCDMAAAEPDEGLVPLGGLLIYYTHGHQYAVKRSLDALGWRAGQRQADIALYGHTHRPAHTCAEGLHLFNPGSVSLPRRGVATYGKITIQNGMAEFEIGQISR